MYLSLFMFIYVLYVSFWKKLNYLRKNLFAEIFALSLRALRTLFSLLTRSSAPGFLVTFTLNKLDIKVQRDF